MQPGSGYFCFIVPFKVNRGNRIHEQTICDHVWTAVIGTKSRRCFEAFERPQQMLETHLAFSSLILPSTVGKEPDIAFKGNTGIEKSSRDVSLVLVPIKRQTLNSGK